VGGSQAALAGETARQTQELSNREFLMSRDALKSGLDYAGSQYKAGGIDQSGKFQALLTDTAETNASAPLGSVGNLGGVASRESDLAAARAIGFTGVGQGKVLSAVDEINKLRSVLSSQGLKTTGLGSEGFGTANQALSLLPAHPALSTGLGIAAGAASVYGALNKPTSPGPQSTTIAPLSPSQLPGSDLALIQGGGPTAGYFSSPGVD